MKDKGMKPVRNVREIRKISEISPKTAPDQWVALANVIDLGGYAAAAEALDRSQSAVSYQVTRLQEALGCRLLFTTRRRDLPSTFASAEVRVLPAEAAVDLLLSSEGRRHLLAGSDAAAIPYIRLSTGQDCGLARYLNPVGCLPRAKTRILQLPGERRLAGINAQGMLERVAGKVRWLSRGRCGESRRQKNSNCEAGQDRGTEEGIAWVHLHSAETIELASGNVNRKVLYRSNRKF